MPRHLADLSEQLYVNRYRKYILETLTKTLKVDSVDLKAYWNYDKGGEVLSFRQLDVMINIKEDHRVDFHLSELRGSCCWVVMHFLSNYVESLKLQLMAARIIAKYCRYGGVIITHIAAYSEDCQELILASGYEMIGDAFNPHSNNRNNIFLNALDK